MTQDTTAVLETLAQYHGAMVAADLAALDALLSRDFSLTHITGYEQPKAEWFGVIRSGAFDYHRITLDNSQTTLEVRGDTAAVSGRGIFHATINGMHNPWRLAFNIQLIKQGQEWKIGHAHYTSF